jgi:DNA-directed RNA polymerase subunit M/transcription elongation factor TFIIS
LYFITGEHFADKAGMIKQWMERAQQQQKRLAEVEPPIDIRCPRCCVLMICTERLLEETGALFFFECQRCFHRRRVYENGREWRALRRSCPKCQSTLQETHVRSDKDVTTMTKCGQCGHEEVEKWRLGDGTVHQEEIVDNKYLADRARFCLSEEEGAKYLEGKRNIEKFAQTVRDIQQRLQEQELYDAVKQLQVLTVPEIEKILMELLQQSSYSHLEFAAPEIKQDVVLTFSVQDAQSGRTKEESVGALKRLVETALKSTNWKLMSQGLSYRLGVLQGRIRGLEKEKDLVELVRGKKKDGES